MQKRSTCSVIFCLTALGALGFSASASAESPPIKIGVIGPITGPSEDMGLSMVGGARVFLADINQVGGVLGRKIELVERDDHAKPDVGAAMAKEMIEKENVVAVVGFGNTGVALPAAKIFQEAKIPLIVTGATGATITKSFMPPAYPVSYIFRTSASDALQPIVILNDVIDRRKIDKIALLHDDSPYGQFGKQSMLAELERRKIKPVLVESFKVGDQDMTTQLQHAKDNGAQAIVMYCLATEGAMVVKSSEKLKLKLPIVGPWTLSQQTFIDKAGQGAEGVRSSVTFIENELSSVSNQFSLTYRNVNKTNHIPSAVAAAQTYDALRLITLAIFQANSVDGAKIKDALENLQVHTTSTIVSRYFKPFSPTDHEAIALNMIVMGEIRNGKVAYAYREDASNGSIARTKKN
ncbi:amino acid/amide ABC transporter substrate-binding protein, HAAT family (TC 3.A.1.4.-) [Collimonas sp. OK242]|uniref:ABC transporter substrate-binding protein n=1 Tax=Collimonas sp. OK242 TaxID=1798195 RepID=UPI000898C6FC|nr:ABC transporter substrate-binding protein [Collimonas sp. OK242]SDY93578.1 amino acid/amide ABC transporter substrate-binding protein, HAAT family (TC 3.A.1.4.-) [Collimonas sp. OK242]